MATRRGAANAAMSMDEAEQSTTRPGKVAAFLPVDNKGNPVEMNAGDDWHMPTGRDLTEISGSHDEEEDEAPQTPADRVISMLAEVEDDQRAYVKVSRVIQGKPSWCEDYSAATFEAGGYKMIREQWGPGEYQVILYGTIPGTKRFTIRTRATVQIEAPLKAATPEAPQSELSQFMMQMAQTQERLLQAVTERPQVDPMAQMTQMFTMMKLMREAMGGDPKPASGLGDIVNAIKQLREVNEEINPSREPESPMGMVTKMLPLIKAGLEQRQQQAPAPVPQLGVQRPNPNPVAIHAPQITIAETPKETPEMNLAEIVKQKSYLATLVQMGKDGRQADEAAKFVYDNLSDDLIDALAKPEWWDLFKAIAPGDIEPQKEWFGRVRDLALGMFEPAEEEEAPPASDAD